VIHYADGVETLAIETRFEGEGTDFAWVVPVPSQPEVLAVSPGAFSTLRLQTQPWVEHAPHLSFTVVALAVCGLLVCFGMASDRFTLLAVVLFMLAFVVLLLPGLGRDSGGPGGPQVTIHDVRTIGDYDVTTLSSSQPEALVDWLSENGFQMPDRARPVVGAYVKEGWAFAAVKLHREAAGKSVQAPHPLAFRFKTDTPVYPMRLTGVGSGPCSVDLYVFGDRRARAAGFDLAMCDRPEYRDDPRTADAFFLAQDRVEIGHNELRELVNDAPVMTKLTRSFAPEEMDQDVYLDWEPYERTFPHLVTDSTVLTRVVTSLLVFVVPAVGLVLGLAFRRTRGASWRARCLTMGAPLIVFLIASVVALHLWGVERTDDPDPSAVVNRFAVGLPTQRFEMMVCDAIDVDRPLPTVTEDWLQEHLRPRIEAAIEKDETSASRNPYTGEPRQYRDAPGDYGLEVREGEAVLILYGIDGGGTEYPL
jgi:hypothetical protein